ncbi:hypothetical protein GXW78_17735 [Roseomonas terrae]|jgi:hypothetical protein|uniref:Uncharacterized protein n=1 Tax=Neoroseomonas terrae TaxID=424799 RepID=A0ABS5EKF8_9PROT|nr:hypothetical protein [Neoroseomonas terrae]MBR0651516.1 hypothetical protein [Neoroseomonas terrae]
MRSHPALALLLLAAACTPQGTSPTLPQGVAAPGATNRPVLGVGREVTSFFRNPQPNQPAAAARAIAELEWLADNLPNNPRWQNASAVGLNGIQQSRWEARRALGIPERAPGQAVINGLAGAARAIDANDQAALARALPRGTFPLGAQETVRRLSAPPQVRDVMGAYEALITVPVMGATH